ncbi:MAG: glycosyltransferase family 4 protein [Rhodopirellula sp.]|nr:glycosyltransferase family 4 protein [Rhodopirellula sp.]
MDLAVVLEYRFERTPDGAVWTQTMFPHSFWTRYLDVFDRVRIIARARDVDAAPERSLRVDGEGVELFGIPYYHGPGEYLRQFVRVGKAVKRSVEPEHAIILRVGSMVGNLVERRFLKAERPFGVEVVGDPWEVFAPAAMKHPLRPLLRRYFTRCLKRQCSRACAVAYVTESALQRRYPASPECLSTHYSSVELGEAAFKLSSNFEFCKGETPHLITVGTLEQRYKGIDVLIDAVTRCIREGFSLRLTILGDGIYRGELEARAERAGCRGQIIFAGTVPPGEAVRRKLDEADLFVLASRLEGVPRAMIEAMARGLPCIGTDVGGIPELLPPEDLVAANDAAALATKIREVLTDPDRLRQSARRNLETAARYRDDRLRERRLLFYGTVRDATEKWLPGVARSRRPLDNNARSNKEGLSMRETPRV